MSEHKTKKVRSRKSRSRKSNSRNREINKDVTDEPTATEAITEESPVADADADAENPVVDNTTADEVETTDVADDAAVDEVDADDDNAEAANDAAVDEVDADDAAVDDSAVDEVNGETADDAAVDEVDGEAADDGEVDADAPSEMDVYANKLYDEVKALWPEDQELTLTNSFDLLRLAMETVDTYQGLKGAQKKELVVRLMHRALDEFVLADLENQALRSFVNSVLEITIDNFVDIDLGNLHINEEQKKKWKARFKKCMPCLFKSSSSD